MIIREMEAKDVMGVVSLIRNELGYDDIIMRGLAFELDGEYIRVIALAVSRAYQSLGIGSKLEARVEQYAAETGANSIVISSGLTRSRAHMFYSNKGYEKKGYSFIKRIQPEKKFSYEDVIFTPIPSRLGKDDDYDASWLDEDEEETDEE